jgi:hypothetical protein
VARDLDVLRQHVLPKLERIRPTGGSFKASCPVPGHGKGNGDRNPSLSIAPGNTQPVIFKCQAGCHQDDVKAALVTKGIDWALCSEPRSDRPSTDTWMPCGHTKVAEYLYRDQAGEVVFGVARCARKSDGCEGFRQWRPDPANRSGRRWSLKNEDGTRAVPDLPYRLPEVLAAIKQNFNIWLPEGEKDVDRLWSLGYPATCNAGGGTTDRDGKSKWTAEQHARWLVGADVMIVADRDQVGRAHADHVVRTLLPVARSVEVLQAAHGKDVSDHINGGGTIRTLVSVGIPKPAPVAVEGCPDCANEGAQ